MLSLISFGIGLDVDVFLAGYEITKKHRVIQLGESILEFLYQFLCRLLIPVANYNPAEAAQLETTLCRHRMMNVAGLIRYNTHGAAAAAAATPSGE